MNKKTAILIITFIANLLTYSIAGILELAKIMDALAETIALAPASSYTPDIWRFVSIPAIAIIVVTTMASILVIVESLGLSENINYKP